MRVEVLGRGKAVAVDAGQLVARREDGTVVAVLWEHAPGAVFVTHPGDADFDDVCRLLGLPGVTVESVEIPALPARR